LIRSLIATAALLILAGCGGSAAPANSGRIKVQLAVPTKGIHILPYYLGQEKGVFAAQGVDLDIQVLQANAAIAAIINGSVDFSAAGGSAMRAAMEGSPARVVFVTVGKPDSFVYSKPDLSAVSGLKGKNIAITSVAGSPAVMAKNILRANGLDADKDVKLVATETTANAFAALKAGAVEAAILDPPYNTMAANAGFHLLAQGSDYLKGTQTQLATSVKTIQSDPEKVRRMLRGSLKAIDYTLKHEDEAVDFISKTWELSPDDARGTFHTVADALLRNGLPPVDALQADLVLLRYVASRLLAYA